MSRQRTTDPLLLIGLAHRIFSESISSVLNSKMQMTSNTLELEAVLNVTFYCSTFLVRALGELSIESNLERNPFRRLLVSIHIHLICESIHGISKTFTIFQEGINPNMLYMLVALNSHLSILA